MVSFDIIVVENAVDAISLLTPASVKTVEWLLAQLLMNFFPAQLFPTMKMSNGQFALTARSL
jgi:uncharacterized membrane protein